MASFTNISNRMENPSTVVECDTSTTTSDVPSQTVTVAINKGSFEKWASVKLIPLPVNTRPHWAERKVLTLEEIMGRVKHPALKGVEAPDLWPLQLKPQSTETVCQLPANKHLFVANTWDWVTTHTHANCWSANPVRGEGLESHKCLRAD